MPSKPGHSPRPWHLQAVTEAVDALKVDPAQGLEADEVEARLAAHGRNEIAVQRRHGPLKMLLAQFSDFMILVLIAAAVVAGLVGEPQDSIAIVVIVALNAVIGFVQEYRAERAMAALQRMAAPSARVLRAGSVHTVAASGLVPGDVVLLEAGNVVPADLRLTEAVRLKVEEAALTGESQPVDKHSAALHDPELPLGDRCNMAYKGTVVSYGRGTGLVTATGMHTELGKIAALLHGEREVKTPLQKRLTQFGQRLALAVLAICAIIFAAGVLRGEATLLMFMTAVSLAVAAIPEALPAVVTISLTQNRMRAEGFYGPGPGGVDGPPPPRGPGRRGAVPHGGHHPDNDHRRPPGHRPRHRPAPGYRRRRRQGDHRTPVGAAFPAGIRAPGRPGAGVRPGCPGAENQDRQGAAGQG